MARYTCPSCGAGYNGKLCRNCFYEHFTEEIAHGNHTHKGEPLVIDAPVRKPVKRKDPFGCEKRTRKRHPLAGLLVLLFVINALLPMIRNWGLELETMEERYLAAEPEPEPFMPEDAMLLHEEGGIRIYADWQDGQEFDDFPIYVENDYNYNVYVSSRNVVVNGLLMDRSGAYCDAYKNSTSRATFYLDGTDLDNARIEQVQEITFQLEVCDTDYTTLFTTDTICLTAAASDSVQPTDLGGTLLYAQEDIRISYLGYAPNAYYADEIAEGTLLFYLENGTDRTLQFYPSTASVAGGETELFFWQEVPPRTRAVVSMYLYELDEFGITSLAEMAPMTLQVEISDAKDSDFCLYTDPVDLALE